MPKDPRELAVASAAILNRLWMDINNLAGQGTLEDALDDGPLRDAIRQSINSGTKTYRYVLPTQLVAKLADASVDCRSVQVAGGRPGAFDARSICDKVIVPFDRGNNAVLGGSAEPYVNNPLRVPEITPQYSSQQKDKAGWSALCLVLDRIEVTQDIGLAENIFRQILIEIHRRLALVEVTYPVPRRTSLEGCSAVVAGFLADGSGGDRPQAVISALFRALGVRFGLYSEVRRGHTNTADVSSGQVADLECIAGNGEIVMAVEVKDKALTVTQMQDKLPRMREQHVSEIFSIALRGLQPAAEGSISALVAKEFASGQNIYVFDDFASFLKATLALLGEDGRRQFLATIGLELDVYRSDIVHRRAWADLLSQI